MSAEFSNTYQEILLDNLMSIIKQNFVFQTQLKIAENFGKQKEELQLKYDELFKKYSLIEPDLKLIEQYKAKANSNDSAHAEKQRIQTALNTEMQKTAKLKKDLETKETELEELKSYIQKLEEIAPVTKLKKIKTQKEKTVVPKIVEESKINVDGIIKEIAPINLFELKADGGTF